MRESRPEHWQRFWAEANRIELDEVYGTDGRLVREIVAIGDCAGQCVLEVGAGGGIVSAVVDVIHAIISTVVDSVTSIIACSVVGAIIDPVCAVVDIVRAVIGTIAYAIRAVIGAIADCISAVVGAIANSVGALGRRWVVQERSCRSACGNACNSAGVGP